MLPLKRTYVDMEIVVESALYIILGIFQVLVMACIIYGLLYLPFMKVWNGIFPCQSANPEPDFEKGKTSFLRHYEKECENKKINWV